MASTSTFLALAAEAVARNVARKAALQHHKQESAAVPWTGLTESDAVTCIEEFFSGCGYWTWREDAYGVGATKMDLWAKDPLANPGATGWCVEAKILWDGADNRLGKKRFLEKGEVLKDFEYLERCERAGASRVVFWVVFSDMAKLEPSSSPARLGVPEAVETVEARGWRVARQRVVDVSGVVTVSTHPYVHVLVWEWVG